MTHAFLAEIRPQVYAVIVARSLFAVRHSVMSAGISAMAHTQSLKLALISAKDAGAT